jgi:hypothetical protein
VSVWNKVRGTIETIFQIGLGGPQLKNNAGAIEARNSADTGYAVARGASPVGDQDFATKQYVDTLFSRTVVALQFNGGNALPSNSGTEQFYVVTTSGANATIGQLLWDDGSGSGTVSVLAARSQMIVTTAAFSGGTVSLSADSAYIWDATQWVNAAGVSLSGPRRVVRFAITNAASQSSAKQIPANATVRSCLLDVVTPFSAGATGTVGQTGAASLLMGTTDNLLTVAGQYAVDLDAAWGASPLAVLFTVAGSPAAGAGFLVVEYTNPDA